MNSWVNELNISPKRNRLRCHKHMSNALTVVRWRCKTPVNRPANHDDASMRNDDLHGTGVWLLAATHEPRALVTQPASRCTTSYTTNDDGSIGRCATIYVRHRSQPSRATPGCITPRCTQLVFPEDEAGNDGRWRRSWYSSLRHQLLSGKARLPDGFAPRYAAFRSGECLV